MLSMNILQTITTPISTQHIIQLLTRYLTYEYKYCMPCKVDYGGSIGTLVSDVLAFGLLGGTIGLGLVTGGGPG